MDSVQVKSTDMPEGIREVAVQAFLEAQKGYDVERDIAFQVKSVMDRKFGGPWHCVVGRDYGSFVTHESGYFLFATCDGLNMLLFRTKG